MYRISVKGKVYLFETPLYCGAMFVGKNGRERANVPRLAWDAISWWAQQGRRIDDSGLCIWDYPAKEKLKHLGGRHYQIIGYEQPVRGS